MAVSPQQLMENKPLNRSMIAAKASKQDEFYTQLSDIEKELRNYTTHFKGKTVLCNCDDPRVSNFFHYFSYNFQAPFSSMSAPSIFCTESRANRCNTHTRTGSAASRPA